MSALQVLVVDDEPLARKRLARLLAELEGYELAGEADNGLNAISACQRLHPDIVLMDIRMPAMDGLEACRLIMAEEETPAIIFCTAYDDYALAAFESQAIAYLLKPARKESLHKALQRAQRLHRARLSHLKAAAGSRRAHLSASTRQGVELVPVAEVRLLAAEQKYVSACHPGGELLLEDSLRDLETEFPEDFVRIHRNALVNLRHVDGLENSMDGVVVCLSGIERRPQVSRRHLAALRKLLRGI